MEKKILSNKMDRPILIYIAMDGCHACKNYDKEWPKVMKALQGRATFVKINCYEKGKELPPPVVLAPYANWFPSIVLAGPNSYYRCFTPDDQVNKEEYSDKYLIKGVKFNAVWTGKEFEFTGRDNSAENTINWFNQTVGSIPQIDEQTPPRLFSNMPQGRVLA